MRRCAPVSTMPPQPRVSGRPLDSAEKHPNAGEVDGRGWSPTATPVTPSACVVSRAHAGSTGTNGLTSISYELLLSCDDLASTSRRSSKQQQQQQPQPRGGEHATCLRHADWQPIMTASTNRYYATLHSCATRGTKRAAVADCAQRMGQHFTMILLLTVRHNTKCTPLFCIEMNPIRMSDELCVYSQ